MQEFEDISTVRVEVQAPDMTTLKMEDKEHVLTPHEEVQVVNWSPRDAHTPPDEVMVDEEQVLPPKVTAPAVDESLSPPEGDNMVRRSQVVPARFIDRLVGSDEYFLEYLKRCHSVLIFFDRVKRKLHIKGRRDNVLVCYSVVRYLLAEWRRREDDAELAVSNESSVL